jgi:LPPG:FO 2-phospho-L-lactate transferase
MISELGSNPGPEAIAAHYQGLIDGLVFDKADKQELDKVSSGGLVGLATNTLMNSDTDEKVLAENVLDFAVRIA